MEEIDWASLLGGGFDGNSAMAGDLAPQVSPYTAGGFSPASNGWMNNLTGVNPYPPSAGGQGPAAPDQSSGGGGLSDLLSKMKLGTAGESTQSGGGGGSSVSYAPPAATGAAIGNAIAPSLSC